MYGVSHIACTRRGGRMSAVVGPPQAAIILFLTLPLSMLMGNMMMMMMIAIVSNMLPGCAVVGQCGMMHRCEATGFVCVTHNSVDSPVDSLVLFLMIFGVVGVCAE
jgi:hypothetical protein